MSKKFKVWLDSGANAQSCYEQVLSLSDIGLTDDEWVKMTEREQDDIMREEAFSKSDWGYTELPSDSNQQS
jgi:hypothetical protein